MSEQGKTDHIDRRNPQHDHVHYQQDSMESQDTKSKQRPARYRKRGRMPLKPLSLAQQSSTLSHAIPRSLDPNGFHAYSATEGPTMPVLQRQHSQYPANEPYATGFVASQVNIININNPMTGLQVHPILGAYSHLPNTSKDSVSLTPGNRAAMNPVAHYRFDSSNAGAPSALGCKTQPHSGFQSRRLSLPSQHLTPQIAQSRATYFAYPGNDRTTLPSQRQQTPAISFPILHHMPRCHVPGARMVNIPPPQNYSTADGLARPPTPYLNQHAAMPMAPLAGFGMPLRKGFSESKGVESISMPNFGVGAMPSRGHRRNKTTISQLSDVVSRTSAHKGKGNAREPEAIRAVGGRFGINSSDSERIKLPAFNFGSSSGGTMDGANRFTNDMLARKDFEQNTAPPALYYKRKATPNSAVSSTADVTAFLERNPPFASTPMSRPTHSSSSSKENIIPFPSRTHEHMSFNDSSSTVASDSWNIMDAATTALKKEVGVRFNLEGDLPAEMDILSLADCVHAGHNDGVQVYDFAYPDGTPPSKKHVRFASNSDHAPSIHYLSNSEDSTASKRVLIDLRECEAGINDDRGIRSSPQDEGGDNEKVFILPATTYKSAGKELSVDTQNESDSIKPHKLTKPRDQQQQPPTKHKRSGSRDLLRRASNSLHKFAAARAGMAPVRNDGELDRGFQFPARDSEKRVSSMPILHANVRENAEGHKRRSSFGRLLEGVGVKQPSMVGPGGDQYGGKNQGKSEDKNRESLGRRVSGPLGGFMVRKGR